ncbi:archaeal proteasome endopeptidase complex subunit beta [Haloprofundus halophilus]|uniref:archaeal proteasome endopeptidase complex subunit beta n=1 Tax=Haloprofundus halophilus TaxID=2283527 RepID=UPI000E43A9BE|nr:archaeal proteasome endopeptidase complex subunit beta [Haloprofundus halophilus]
MRPPTSDFSGSDSPLDGNRSRVFGPELGEFPNAEQSSEPREGEMKTGTTTVGIKTEDGVVLATDMRASAGYMVASKDVQKVEEIHPTGALTIAGSVSAAQSLIRSLRAETRLYEARRGEEMSMTALSTLVGNFLRSGGFLIVSPILGGVDSEGSHVYSIDPAGGTTEEEYTVSGSGSQYALGVLEQDYDESLSLDEAKDVATRAIKSAVERDLASGNGINIAVVTEDGVDIERHKDIESLL